MTQPRRRPRAYAAARARRAPLLVGLLVVALASLGACAVPGEEPRSRPIEGGEQLAALWPLTGREVTSDTPDHPVIVVKVDNSEESAPQRGVGQADLVAEELVEGGRTRLAAMFYEDLPDVVGPVRSMRATDIGIVKPTLGVVAASGAAPATLRRVREAGITAFDDRTGEGYSRDPERTQPYDLMLALPELAESVTDEAVVPASYLPWGTEEDVPDGTRARSLDAVFSKEHTTSWRYARGRYVDEDSLAAQGERFDPDTVLVLRVEQGDAGYLDPAGSKVPETLFTGTGEALLLHDGRAVEATWAKDSVEAPLRLESGGEPLLVPAGRTWIELVPRDQDGGRVVLGR